MSVTAIDVLADPLYASHDILHLQRLGINTLEVEWVLPTADHSKSMQLLEKAGIYVIVRVDTKFDTPSWWNGTHAVVHDYTALEHREAVIEAFAHYPNTLGFVINPFHDYPYDFIPMPRIKSWIKHLKEFVRQKASRAILVGLYSEIMVCSLLLV
jgi:hypothetical protein